MDVWLMRDGAHGRFFRLEPPFDPCVYEDLHRTATAQRTSVVHVINAHEPWMSHKAVAALCVCLDSCRVRFRMDPHTMAPYLKTFFRTLRESTIDLRFSQEGHAALEEAAREWTNTEWAGFARACAAMRPPPWLLLQKAVDWDVPTLEGVCAGTNTCLRAASDEIVDWGALKASLKASMENLVDTRVVYAGRETVVRRARHARIHDIAATAYPCRMHVVYANLTVAVCGEPLDDTRTLEAYGVDDETSVCLA